jgi:tetratricopeptide (TPR) repeat protein
MPPEQANGDVALLDRRADVFALGAILCEVLTGKPPYRGRSSEEIRRKAANGDLADAVVRLNDCGADQELTALTKACLSPEVVDRPRDARAVAERLTAYLNGVQERLHQAELAEAQATARAVEEARRRRLTLALAGTVLLAVTLGGGGWLYIKNERDARQARVAREVNEALNRATALYERARAANTGGAALFAQAREQAQRALALTDSGPADPTLAARVRQLQTELDAEEKDHKLMAALDAARLAMADRVVGGRQFATEQIVPKVREAFQEYGLTIGEDGPAAVARLRGRPAAVRRAVSAALDDWVDVVADRAIPMPQTHLDWLFALAVAAEPDEGWGWKFRAARAEMRRDKQRAALEKLAREADVETLPAQTLNRLAWQLAFVGAEDSALALLRRAQPQHPEDFWINEQLGLVLDRGRPQRSAEAVRFYTAAVALRPDSPGAQVNLAVALWRSGDFDGAIACSRRAIHLDPNYAAAHNNLALALQARGQLNEAIASFQKAIELDPKVAQIHTNLAVALEARGRHDEAIACYHKAIEIDPKFADAHFNLGNVYLRASQLDRAIACYRKALDCDPEFVPARGNLANALRVTGHIDEAIACGRQAVKLEPENPLTHICLGNALKDSRRFDEAIACYRRALALDPKNVGALNDLGAILCDCKHDHDGAIVCFRKVLELDPQNVLCHFALGNALRAKGQIDEAIACYRRALALDPKNVRALNDLGAILCDVKHDYDEAIVCFRKILELDPTSALGYTNLANALQGKGQLDEVIACRRRAIELDPKNAMLHDNLGLTLGARGRQEEAIACFRQALSLDPKLVRAHIDLGDTLKAGGQVDEAIACYRQAIQLDPKSSAAHAQLGFALDHKGQGDAAIASYRKAIEFNPKSAALHSNLGTALAARGQSDEAMDCFRKAVALDPKLAVAHHNLGFALLNKGRRDEAIACFRKAIALDPKLVQAQTGLGDALFHDGSYAEARDCLVRALELLPKNDPMETHARRQLEDCERLQRLELRLDRFLRGEDKPDSARQGFDVAAICRSRKMHAAAARFAAAAFAVEPRSADDLEAGHRYDAACDAALAAAGKSKDAAKLDDKEKARLRKQALDWLRADLALRTRQLESGPAADGAAAAYTLRHWQQDPDLASLRDAAALAKLPPEERAVCAKLWADVAALLKKAGEGAK